MGLRYWTNSRSRFVATATSECFYQGVQTASLNPVSGFRVEVEHNYKQGWYQKIKERVKIGSLGSRKLLWPNEAKEVKNGIAGFLLKERSMHSQLLSFGNGWHLSGAFPNTHWAFIHSPVLAQFSHLSLLEVSKTHVLLQDLREKFRPLKLFSLESVMTRSCISC